MIQFSNFSFKYNSGSKKAVDNISFTVSDGDFVGITGPGGAGKSTLVHSMTGIVPHEYQGDFYGAVTVDGMDTVEFQPEDISKVLGCVMQDIEAQLIMPNVFDEMLFGLENFGVPHDEIPDRIDEALEMVGISELKDRETGSLSGGQKQKVAIAEILALKPKYLVLDEPTGELDPKSSRKIFELLRDLNENYGITVVVVEQKIMLLCEFAKKLEVMDKGKIVLSGSVSDVLKHIDVMYKAGISIPRVVSLAALLVKRGFHIEKMPIDLNSAAEMIRAAEEELKGDKT
ncbi:MAG: energy-coupling factor ABC transporter ATP-binding protein [Clostridiales bacterium]|nr:energy-coupling factor ABC transporter ATP-binding protein [Clostridiales bacterium]